MKTRPIVPPQEWEAARQQLLVKEKDADPALTERIGDPGYRAKPERILMLHLVAFDWNCPQHITPRFTETEIAAAVQLLR